MKKFLVIGGSIFALILIVAIIGITYGNKEVRVRNKITAQQEVIEGSFDKMWKIINQKAQVSSEYKDAFREIYKDLIEGRYGNEKGGSLMKLIVESNPNFDVSLYKDLMNSIEAERTSFFIEQKKLIDLGREHMDLLKTAPSSWFVGNRPEIKITIVSSEKTKQIIESGEENDIDLFKKDKKNK